jgi:hypothetical protein
LIDSGENGDLCTFWEWFDDMVPGRSRSDAEKMMTIARQPDPELAYQQRLEKQKEYTERHYQRKFGVPSSDADFAASRASIFDADFSIFDADIGRTRVLSASAEAKEAIPQRRNR